MKPVPAVLDAGDIFVPVTRVYPINETSGATLADLSGSAGDAPIVGTPAFGSDGTWGRWVRLVAAVDDTDGYAKVTFPPIPKDGCSLAVVSTSEDEFNKMQAVISDGTTDYDNGIRGFLGGETDIALMDGGDFVTSSRHSATPGTFHTRIMSISGGTASYFVDGALVGTASKASGVCAGVVNTLTIGASAFLGANSFAKFALVAVLPHASTLADAVAFQANPYGLLDGGSGPVTVAAALVGAGTLACDAHVSGPQRAAAALVGAGTLACNARVGSPAMTIVGTPRVNTSGQTIEWRYPADPARPSGYTSVTFEGGVPPSVAIDGGSRVYLTHDGSPGGTPLGIRSGLAGWVLWRCPTTIAAGQAVALTIPDGAYQNYSGVASPGVSGLAITNDAGIGRFDGVPHPSGASVLGMNTTPPYFYFDRGFPFSDLMVSAGSNIRDARAWDDGAGNDTVVLNPGGWPQSSATGTAAVYVAVNAKFVGGTVPVLWQGAGSVVLYNNTGTPLTQTGEDLTGLWKRRTFTAPANVGGISVVATCPVAAVQVLYPGTENVAKTGPTTAINPAWLAKFRGRFGVIRSLGLQDANNVNNPGGALATPDGYALGQKPQLIARTLASVVVHPSPPPFHSWTGPVTVALVTTTAAHGLVTGQTVIVSGTGGLPGTGGFDNPGGGYSYMVYVESSTTFSVGVYGSTGYALTATSGTISTLVDPGLGLDRIVQLVNATGCNLWYQTNHLMSIATIGNIVAYFAAHLSPGLKLYVERSNEVWNGSFQQQKLAMAWGQHLGLGDLNTGNWAYHGRQTGLMADAAVAAWVAGGRSPADCIPVLAGQAASYVTSQVALARAVADGTAANIKRLSYAPYYGLSVAVYPYWPPEANRENAAFVLGRPSAPSVAPPGALLEMMERDLLDVVQAQSDDWQALSGSSGIPLTSYEWDMHSIRGANYEFASGDGAPAYPSGSNLAVENALIACNRHPREGDLVVACFNQQVAAGAREMCFLGSIGNFTPYAWHQYEYLTQSAGDGSANLADLAAEAGSQAVKAWALQRIDAAIDAGAQQAAAALVGTGTLACDARVAAPQRAAATLSETATLVLLAMSPRQIAASLAQATALAAAARVGRQAGAALAGASTFTCSALAGPDLNTEIDDVTAQALRVLIVSDIVAAFGGPLAMGAVSTVASAGSFTSTSAALVGLDVTNRTMLLRFLDGPNAGQRRPIRTTAVSGGRATYAMLTPFDHDPVVGNIFVVT